MPAGFVDIVGYAALYLLDVGIQPGDECVDDRASSESVNGELHQFVYTEFTDLVIPGPDSEMTRTLDSTVEVARRRGARLGVEIEELEITVALINKRPQRRRPASVAYTASDEVRGSVALATFTSVETWSGNASASGTTLQRSGTRRSGG